MHPVIKKLESPDASCNSEIIFPGSLDASGDSKIIFTWSPDASGDSKNRVAR